MDNKRILRLNSLLKEVIAEVIMKEVRNPHMAQFTTITRVEVSKDLHHGKVFISVIGTDKEKQETLEALESAAGFIAVTAAKKVTLRYFPNLKFKLDSSVDKLMKIDSLLEKIHDEQRSREHPES
jgi:ribosome-binding factor A